MSRKLDAKARQVADTHTVVHIINHLHGFDKTTLLERAKDLGVISDYPSVVLEFDPNLAKGDQLIVNLELEAELREDAVELATNRFGHRSVAMEALVHRAEEVEKALGVVKMGREYHLAKSRA